MTDRAKRGGGTTRPLPDPAVTAAPGQLAAGSRPGSSGGIERGTPADWFGPLNPMEPTAPPAVAGRRLDFPSGYNLTQQPRAYSPVSFATLRGLADGYDVLRTIIETRKDQMERLPWSIAPRDSKTTITTEMQGRIRTLEKFFNRPDRENFWGTWLRMVLEDLLVLDAPSIFKRRTRGGDLYSLEIIDGSTIKKVIDDWGRTPQPPLVAYQQALKGFPAVNYTTRDLLYRPRNMRSGAVYGYSPVEQIIMTTAIGMRRETFQLNYYTEGNMPESLIGTPDNWTPDQIRQFQDWFDGMLEGNLAQRRKAKFVPGGVGKTYVPTKTEEMWGKGEEWLARVCCFAFSISPQPFVEMMNRATAETAQETASADGLLPLMAWTKGTVDTILIDEFGEEELEFKWTEEDEMDPKIESDIVRGYVADGILSINAGRERIGEDSDPDPQFDRLMIKTATGYVPVALTQEEKDAKEAAAAAISGQPLDENGKPKPPQPGAPKQPGTSSDQASADAVGADQPTQGNAPPKDASEQATKVRKAHDDAMHDVERVAQRSPLAADMEVSFGKPAPDAAVITAVLNAAGKIEPNWR